MTQIILHLENVEWEIDYITKDLLSDYSDSPVVSLTREEYCNLSLWEKEEFKELVGNNIMVFNFLVPYPLAKSAVEYLRPKIIFFMSDEFADQHEYNNLANLNCLFLRQYNISSADPQKVFQIPLGYMKGFMKEVSDFKNSSEAYPHKKSTERDRAWSFIGTLKSDRQKMLEEFIKSEVGAYYISHSLQPSDICRIYMDSIFVPCGRGNRSLDCLRLYEASVCGAIPVVAGSPEEIQETFYFKGNLPPWIFASDWAIAASLCKELLESPTLLNQKQQLCIEWWRNINSEIRSKIKTALRPGLHSNSG